MTRREGAVEDSLDVLFYKYAVTDQQCIFDMMNAMLKDSILEFPCKNDGEMIEKGDPPVETVTARAYAREEQINFAVDAGESARNSTETAVISERVQLCPEALKSSRSDLTEKELKWLARDWNFDRNYRESSGATA